MIRSKKAKTRSWKWNHEQCTITNRSKVLHALPVKDTVSLNSSAARLSLSSFRFVREASNKWVTPHRESWHQGEETWYFSIWLKLLHRSQVRLECQMLHRHHGLSLKRECSIAYRSLTGPSQLQMDGHGGGKFHQSHMTSPSSWSLWVDRLDGSITLLYSSQSWS